MIRKGASLTCLTACFTLSMLAGPALAGAGTVTGRIKFDGRMADPRTHRIAGDAFCVDAHRENPVPNEQFVFNYDEGTLVNVLIYVSSPVNGTFTAPDEPAIIGQEGCRYVPHVLGVQAGQLVRIKNSDQTMHNLNLRARANPGFNVGQPMQGMVHEVRFNRPEFERPMVLGCDVHQWMTAYVAVFPHPFFAVSDKKGEFKIEGLPPGKHTLTVWHEFDRFEPVEETIEVEVTEDAEVAVEFTYRPRGR